MKLHVEKRILIGLLVTAFVLAVLGVFSFTSTQRLINAARLLSHASQVINNAEQVMKSIVDIETGQRGFVITGKEEFLEPYKESSKSLNTYLNITAQNSAQQSKVVELRASILHQLEWSKAVIDSHNKEITEIEIGSYEKSEQTCYYIRDNGVGFNMEYVNKLFEVFQRLHKMNEFEGTGVGLALVKAIVRRHGGHVWAEGKVNEGATFYFTLPNEEQIEV